MIERLPMAWRRALLRRRPPPPTVTGQALAEELFRLGMIAAGEMPAVAAEIDQFFADWREGRIVQLARALGLERTDAPER